MDMVVSYDVLGWNNGSRESDHYRYGHFMRGISCGVSVEELVVN